MHLSVNLDNQRSLRISSSINQTISSGADILVAGSFVFNAPNPIATIASLKAIQA